jgi:hypothetical protein
MATVRASTSDQAPVRIPTASGVVNAMEVPHMSVIPFPISPMLAAERAALFDAMDAIIADSEQQQEGQRLLHSLAVWIIFAVKIADPTAKLTDCYRDGWLLAELRKAQTDAEKVAEIFASAVARLRAAIEGDDDGPAALVRATADGIDDALR